MPWSLPFLAKKAEKQICLGICADLVPLDIKWACTCAGKRDVVHTHRDEKKGKKLMKKGRILIKKKGPAVKKAKNEKTMSLFGPLSLQKAPFFFDQKCRFGVLIKKDGKKANNGEKKGETKK